MRKFFKLLFMVSCIFIFLLASDVIARMQEQKKPLKLEEILQKPDKYNGKTIKIDCYYFEGFESVLLASDIIVHDSGYYQLINGKVWAGWRMDRPRKLLEKLLKRIKGRIGDNLYGRVEVEGVFMIKRKGAGHLGEYDYVFGIEKVRIYDDKSDNFVSEE